jgi:uncharacterized membrane protein YhaH (DUF805 family)
MLGTVFGFGGRIGRLAYFGWSVATGLVAGLCITLGALGFVAGFAKGSGGSLASAGLAVAIGLIPLLWMSAALTTKRLRDAGFPPGIVLPLMSVFSVFDATVLSGELGGQPLVTGMFHHSPTGLAVKGLFVLVLLFWPSAGQPKADDREETRRKGEAQWHERALSIASAPLPPQEPFRAIPEPAFAPGPPVRTFGRRAAR